ncbi:uncharacterized protein LOC109080447 isoform X11 [Cyprinus carpio]|uniref:Uncharacterized protein LOC109080447 isoform X11 n=1 Tax=Cyprinus carpio TaxID=7962 RepID=A0A9Q9XBH4_CYPCA|nr:uncharacterized protein LOC109080447 isoform X11 [Cyprinus carpio]
MVRDIADLKNIKVHCFSSYVTVTWLPPLCADPSANLPDHIAECDFILLPSWASNHWMGAPRQNWSNNCGVFVLMYTLYVVMGGILDFAESDMAAVRRWWCLLLLTNYPVKSDAERKLLRKRRKEMKTGITLTKIGELEKEVEADYISKQMPLEILRHILLNVVKEDGDVAFFRLSLTCWLFHDDVCDASFRKDAHLAWLDSVVNWSAYSSDYKEMYRVPYKVTSCLCCGTYLKTSRQAILEMEGKESFVHFT